MTANGLDLSDDFTGRPGAAFVVGGSGGLGAAVVRELAARGSHVAFTFRRNEDAAAQLATTVSDLGRQAWTIGLDLRNHEGCAQAIDAIADAAGGIHTLVYAAGPHVPQKHLSKVTPAEMQEQLDADASGFFAVASLALPHLRQTEGSIVAITFFGSSSSSADALFSSRTTFSLSFPPRRGRAGSFIETKWMQYMKRRA